MSGNLMVREGDIIEMVDSESGPVRGVVVGFHADKTPMAKFNGGKPVLVVGEVKLLNPRSWKVCPKCKHICASDMMCDSCSYIFYGKG